MVDLLLQNSNERKVWLNQQINFPMNEENISIKLFLFQSSIVFYLIKHLNMSIKLISYLMLHEFVLNNTRGTNSCGLCYFTSQSYKCCLRVSVLHNRKNRLHAFFYKNTFYKNIRLRFCSTWTSRNIRLET